MWNINEEMDNMEMYYTRQPQLVEAGKTEITIRDNQGFIEGYVYR